ncbi:hypothetical protein [Providencia sp. Me31A]|uniref:hypothetical protein n=1 Tax=Providencia sp. Me31A TaxID=3392637 RepID=UPI003D2A2B25
MDMKLRDSKLDVIVKGMESEYEKIKVLFEKTKVSKAAAVKKIQEVSVGLVDNKYKNIMEKKLDKIFDSISHESSKSMKRIKKLGKVLDYNKENAGDVRFKLDYEGLSLQSLEFLQSPLESNLKNVSAEKYEFNNIAFENFQGLRGRIFNSIAQYNRDNQNLTNAINRFLKLSHEAEMHVTQLKVDALQSLKVEALEKLEPKRSLQRASVIETKGNYVVESLKPEINVSLDQNLYSLGNQMSAFPSKDSSSLKVSNLGGKKQSTCEICAVNNFINPCWS